jgi:anti-sigma factor RsiW
MKCEELLAALSDYVDGDLDPVVYEAFREHLTDCNPCEVVVDNVRKTITLFKSGQPIELPPELHQQLLMVLRARWEAVFPPAEA